MNEGDPARDDELLSRTRELDEARAAFTRLASENEALRKRLGAAAGAPAPLAPLLTSAAAERGSSGYRGRERLMLVERDLAAINAAIANLQIDNEILAARTGSRVRANPELLRRVVIAKVIVAFGVLLWIVTGNAALFVLTLVLGFFGWGLLTLIDAIKPDGSNPRNPPYLPPPGI
jgi:hypothetical protein